MSGTNGLPHSTHTRQNKTAEYEKIKVEIECPVNVKTAAAILGISTTTLYDWTAQGRIPHIKYEIGRGTKGAIRFMPSEILEFRKRFRRNGGRERIEADVEGILSEINI